MRNLNVSIVLYNSNVQEVNNLLHILYRSAAIDTIYLIDNSPKKLKDQLDLNAQVEYFANEQNIGYGRGHNYALRKSIAQQAYHLVMNHDITFDANILEEMLDYMEQHTDVGLLMPKVYYPSGKLQYLCKLLPSPIDLISRRFLPHFLTKKRIARYEMRATGYSKIMNVPFLSGCFMLLRTEALRDVGVFDERYFMYLEDTDLSRRIHQKYLTIFYPNVSIVHGHGRESYHSPKMLAIHMVNAMRYFNKWGWWNDKDRRRINQVAIEQYC